MLIEPVEILLDKPRKLLINHAALFKAENQINTIRNTGAFTRVGIDYLIVGAMNALTIMKAPFPLDLLAALLWASLVPEVVKSKQGDVTIELSFEDIFPLLDQSLTSTNDIAVALFDAYCKIAGKNIKRIDGETSDDPDAEKKTASPEIGSSSSPLQ